MESEAGQFDSPWKEALEKYLRPLVETTLAEMRPGCMKTVDFYRDDRYSENSYEPPPD
jgi:hypothetical protein